MKLMLELSEQELTASIANGSLVAFIANAGIEKDFRADVEKPKKQPKANDPEPDPEPGPEPEREKEEAPKLKKSDIRPLLAEVQQIDKRAVVDKVREYGKNLDAVPEDKYPELKAWAEEMLSK